MKHIIAEENFVRKEAIEFFRTFVNPNISITSEVECTGAKERAQQHGMSFFLYYLHAMLKAANEIDEFKYRIDTLERIVYYDRIDGISMIRIGGNGAYNSVVLTYDADLPTFARNAQQTIEAHTVTDNPFAEENKSIEDEELNLLLVSAVPGLSFTSINFAQRKRFGGFYPISLVGKMIEREGKEYIPIGISVNHAFVDGYHLERFFARIQELLKA